MVRCESCVYYIQPSLTRSDKLCYFNEIIRDKDHHCPFYHPVGGVVEDEYLKSRGMMTSGIVKEAK